MRTLPTLPSRPRAWWEYAKWVGVVVAPTPTIFGGRLLGALALHITADFTFQSDWMAVGKGRREILPLLIHAVIAGGIPGFYAGGLRGAIILTVLHAAIDATGKFGVEGWPGIVLDQLAHAVAIVAVVAACG